MYVQNVCIKFRKRKEIKKINTSTSVILVILNKFMRDAPMDRPVIRVG